MVNLRHCVWYSPKKKILRHRWRTRRPRSPETKRALSDGDRRHARSLTSLIIHPFYRSEKVGARSYPGGKHCATLASSTIRQYGKDISVGPREVKSTHSPCRVSLRYSTRAKSVDPIRETAIPRFTRCKIFNSKIFNRRSLVAVSANT